MLWVLTGLQILQAASQVNFKAEANGKTSVFEEAITGGAKPPAHDLAATGGQRAPTPTEQDGAERVPANAEVCGLLG